MGAERAPWECIVASLEVFPLRMVMNILDCAIVLCVSFLVWFDSGESKWSLVEAQILYLHEYVAKRNAERVCGKIVGNLVST